MKKSSDSDNLPQVFFVQSEEKDDIIKYSTDWTYSSDSLSTVDADVDEIPDLESVGSAWEEWYYGGNDIDEQDQFESISKTLTETSSEMRHVDQGISISESSVDVVISKDEGAIEHHDFC